MFTRFNLNNAQAKKPTLIYASIRWDGLRMKYTTKLKANPKDWNQKSNNPVRQSHGPSYADFNFKLRKFAQDIESVIMKCQEMPTKPELRKLLDIKFDRVEDKSKLFAFWQSYVKGREEKKTYSKATADLHYYSIDLLKKYDSGLTWKVLDKAFGASFLEFLYSKNLGKNTAAIPLNKLKQIIVEASSEGIKVNQAYKRWTIPKKESFGIYFNEAELQRLLKFEFDKKHLTRAVAAFVLNCYIGARVGDYSRLTMDNISDGIISYTMQKKKKEQIVSVPVFPIAKKIIDQYNGFPKIGSQRNYNRQIREAAKLAGFTDLVRVPVGNGEDEKLVPKHELVSSHSCRRSFVTNLERQGATDAEIMTMGGWESMAAFSKYKKSTPTEKAKIYQNKFFQNTLKIAK